MAPLKKRKDVNIDVWNDCYLQLFPTKRQEGKRRQKEWTGERNERGRESWERRRATEGEQQKYHGKSNLSSRLTSFQISDQ